MQRPDSVVKELLENSIDAGATSVSVIIKEGGKTLIEVADNGRGMSEDDSILAFARHATSKISSYDDIENIRTLGFRGEALASIAAVAHVELRSRRPEDEVASCIRIDGGVVKERTKAGDQPGTSIFVRDLFYNTPARRNFLKGNNAEFRHIYDVIQRVALSHPELAVKFISDGEELLNLKPGPIEERLKGLYGERHFETLIRVGENSELVSISGFVGKPEFARKSRIDQYLFLNKRPIANRAINHAIFSAYEHAIEKGNFPFYLISLEIDPRRVDVNVHPSKMEVKFADEQGIYRHVLAAVRNALGTGFNLPSLEMEERGGNSRFTALRHAPLPRLGTGWANARTGSGSFAPEPTRGETSFSPDESSLDRLFSGVPSALPPLATPRGSLSSQQELNSETIDAHGIWQLHNKYILVEIDSGLMIIDQHVAHERVLYERALASLNQAVPSSQQLLFPHTFQLQAGDFALAKELLPHLIGLGFALKVFGKNTLVLEGVAADVKPGKEGRIVQDILDEFKNNQLRVKLDARDNVAKSYSCKAAVKAGDKLAEAEMRGLIDSLFRTSMPYVCPHGRPIVVKISLGELDRRFMRTS